MTKPYFYETLPEAKAVEESTETEVDDLEASFDEVVETEDKSEDNSDTETEDEAEESAEDEPEVKSEEVEETPEDGPKETLSDEDKQKQHNREMAEKRIQERKDREDKLKKEQQDYVAEADESDPRDLAVRQLQVDAYNNKVESNTNKLTIGYDRAIKDFDVLSDPSPEIQSELASALDAFQAMHVTLDKYGNPTEVRGDLYQYLQAKADSISRLTGIRSKLQEKNKAKEKSKAIITPGRAPKAAKSNPMLDGFDEEAAR